MKRQPANKYLQSTIYIKVEVLWVSYETHKSTFIEKKMKSTVFILTLWNLNFLLDLPLKLEQVHYTTCWQV